MQIAISMATESLQQNEWGPAQPRPIREVGISGSEHEPLSLAESGRGMLVLDGHERAAVRQEKSVPKSLPSTSIPWSWFN